jgi:hypothetical protein
LGVSSALLVLLGLTSTLGTAQRRAKTREDRFFIRGSVLGRLFRVQDRRVTEDMKTG